MAVIKIGGRDVEIRATYGHFAKLVKRYPDIAAADKWDNAKYNRFCIDAIWTIMKRGFLFKPFIFKSRIINNISFDEILFLQKNIDSLLMGKPIETEEKKVDKKK